MYGWIWRHLPGPTPARAAQAFGLFLLVVLILFLFVFPWLQQHLPFTNVTISSAPALGQPFAPNRGI